MSQYHACKSRNTYPGEIVLSEKQNKITCQENIDLSFQESDFHAYQLLDIFRGRRMNQYNGFRQLNTNKDSKILVLITSHGGKGVIQVRNFFVLTDELNLTLNEMYIKGKYKELIFILDACEAYSLYDHVNVPNIFFIASSSSGQKGFSGLYDKFLIGPTVNKFHYLLYKNIKEIYDKKMYNTTIFQLLIDIKANKTFLESDVEWENKIYRMMYVKDFFGNIEIPNEKTLDISNVVNINNISYENEEDDIFNNFIDSNWKLESSRKITDGGLVTMRNYHEEKYSF